MKIELLKHYKKTYGCSNGRCPACYLATEHSECFDVCKYRYPFMDHLETFRDKHKGCTVIGGERIIVCHDYKTNLQGKPYEDFISVCNRAGIQVRVFGDSWYSSDTVRLEFRNASLHVDD